MVFESDQGSYVQFAFRNSGPRAYAEIGTYTRQTVLGTPLTDSMEASLIQRGFRPPEGDRVNYWQEFDNVDAVTLSELTEWAFMEIFGETRRFTVKVTDFD